MSFIRPTPVKADFSQPTPFNNAFKAPLPPLAPTVEAGENSNGSFPIETGLVCTTHHLPKSFSIVTGKYHLSGPCKGCGKDLTNTLSCPARPDRVPFEIPPRPCQDIPSIWKLSPKNPHMWFEGTESNGRKVYRKRETFGDKLYTAHVFPQIKTVVGDKTTYTITGPCINCKIDQSHVCVCPHPKPDAAAASTADVANS